MAIPESIKKLANDIRTKIYGKEVREALAKGIEEAGNIADETQTRQDELEGQFQTVLDETTGKDVISAPEILAARVSTDGTSHSNLKERLDKEHQEVTTQLAQIVQKPHEIILVGNNADFSNINEALEYLSKRHARYFPQGYTAEILLKSGFVMKEQIFVDGIDLSWITLSSEDAEVIINRSYLTEDRLGNDTYSAFTVRNGSLPIINALFNMDNSGTSTNRHGIYVRENAKAIILQDKGVKNAGGVGLRVAHSSIVHANNAVFSNAVTGIYASHASTVNAANADVSGASVYGLYSTHVSVINANSANARRESSDSSDDIRVVQGGLINANGATGGTSQTPNQLTANGIIFK